MVFQAPKLAVFGADAFVVSDDLPFRTLGDYRVPPGVLDREK